MTAADAGDDQPSLLDNAGGAGSPPPESGSDASGAADPGDAVSLHEAAQSRYLNYALSVITSRALPDVRDGLKPVQRRILYTMWEQRLTAEAKHRKCAKVVGDVMGSYHPHGDSAIYDTLVRMAQDFSLRYPLIDGSGNFGSLDGDPPAAYRYTECRLAPIARELLEELQQKTVDMRPNFDGTKEEPVVLPARIPNVLLNGATGIAVGMATNIPPHNLGEVCTALIKLVDNPELSTRQLCRWVKAPDFPTGGQIVNALDEIKAIYETGQGAIKLRATWEMGPITRSVQTVHITSVPYMVNKSVLMERIAEVVGSRKLPALIDARDLSADDVRIDLEIKRDVDPQLVLAYLFKHTPLQTNFNVNMTCLVPTENPLVGRPERLDLRTILWHFLHFRLDVVTRRLEHELAALKKRIHILEGFEKVFDALDEIIKIIRASDGKADAAQTIMARFDLDAEQTDAILELKLYRLAKLEILVIKEELEEKRRRASEIEGLLGNEQGRWTIVRDELQLMKDTYGGKDDKRRTLIQSAEDEPEFSAEDFIIDEDAMVILTRDGWIKRQREVKDLSKTKVREGDGVLAALAGSTRATIILFSNYGVAYTARITDIPASTGYGEPIQKLFKLADGESIVFAVSADPRALKGVAGDPADADQAPPTHALAASSDGYALRFSLESYLDPSTRNGRKFMRLAGKPGQSGAAQCVGVAVITGDETIIAATRQARAILCKAAEVSFLSGAGKGVQLIKIAQGPGQDRLLGFLASTGDRDLMTVETARGATQTISSAKYELTSRGGKGREILKRGQLTRIVTPQPSLPEPLSSS